MIRLYRLFLSPLIGGQCRFYPSCSHYFEEALKKYRWEKAFYLSLKRILRCHPWHPGGFDRP